MKWDLPRQVRFQPTRLRLPDSERGLPDAPIPAPRSGGSQSLTACRVCLPGTEPHAGPRLIRGKRIRLTSAG